MKKVNLHFRFVTNQFIQEVRELSFETVDVNLNDYVSPEDAYVFEGDIKGLWIVDDLEVSVNCRGTLLGFWTLDVKIDGKKLTEKPIEGKPNSKGISIHYQSYKLP